MSETIWKVLQTKLWGIIGVVAVFFIMGNTALKWKNTQYEVQIMTAEIQKRNLAVTLSQVNNLFSTAQSQLIQQINNVLVNNGFTNLARAEPQIQIDTTGAQQ